MRLEGGDLLIILSGILFTVVYFLTAIVPYHKKIISTNPVFQQVPILVLRRLLYFNLVWLVSMDIFYILDLDGKEILRLLVLIPLLVLVVLASVLVYMDKERRLVLQWIFFRVTVFLALYLFKAAAFF